MSQSFIGTALKDPVKLINGAASIASGLTVIQQSITRILSTPVGSVFFNPDYGSRLHELLFEPNDEVVKNLLTTFVKEAVEKWERRVQFVSVSFRDADSNMIECEVVCKVLVTNEVNTFVYPFYKELKY